MSQSGAFLTGMPEPGVQSAAPACMVRFPLSHRMTMVTLRFSCPAFRSRNPLAGAGA